jgi:hypothetical protein
MIRLRFTVAQLMAIVIYLGFGFAALRNANVFWASATYTLALILVATALIGALARNGAARTMWTGFAVFGLGYLLIVLLPPRDTGGLGFGPVEWPHLLSEWGLAQLQPYLHPIPRTHVRCRPGPRACFSMSRSVIRWGSSSLDW